MLKASADIRNPDLIGRITGYVKDSLSGEKLPHASIQLFSVSANKMMERTIADKEGHFIFEDIDCGAYKIMTSYMGYHTKELLIEVDEENETFCLLLTTNMLNLNEVQVPGNRKLIETTIKKTIVNVSQNNTIRGSTISDVLQTIPSVDVDFDGNIRYRGSEKVMLLINGKKSALEKSLEQLPSDVVEKIEIFHNPSAKYTAEEMSGIINIVLAGRNKNENSTSLQLNAGDHNLFGGNIGYSLDLGKTELFVSAGLNHKTSGHIKNHYRTNRNHMAANSYSQCDLLQDKPNKGFLNTSFNYKINNKNYIGLSAFGTKAITLADRSIDYTTIANNGTIKQESHKNIGIEIESSSFESEVSYKTVFNREGQQLETFIKYSEFDDNHKMENRHFCTNLPELQNTVASQLNKVWYGGIEFIHPVSDSVFFEGGYHMSEQNTLNYFSSEIYNYKTAGWNTDRELDSRFRYCRHVEALFFAFNIKKNSWKAGIGIRTEYASTTQNEKSRSTRLNIFPTINFATKITDTNNLYVVYNRRINHPSAEILDPFANKYPDELNIYQGNPELTPEFVNSFEIGERFYGKRISGAFSLYYRYIRQAISKVKQACNDSALVVTYQNLDYATLAGCDFVASFQPFKWGEISTTANFFCTSLSDEIVNTTNDRCRFAWNGSISFQLRLPKAINCQMAGYYRSKLPSIMGTYKERWYADLAVSKKILKNKGQITFKIEDIFDSYLYGLSVNSCTGKEYLYSQQNLKKIDSEYFMLSFIYNINGKSQSKKTEKDSFYLDSFEK
ncbi:outer membrane beta-barrel family protein [Maribellus comscasis]|nr:outer membrane beta-barrel family protein [Maribellus comscasis]